MTDQSIPTLAPFAAIRTARPTRVRFVVLALLAVGTKNGVLLDARARAAALLADVGACLGQFVGALSYIFILGDVKRMEVA